MVEAFGYALEKVLYAVVKSMQEGGQGHDFYGVWRPLFDLLTQIGEEDNVTSQLCQFKIDLLTYFMPHVGAFPSS